MLLVVFVILYTSQFAVVHMAKEMLKMLDHYETDEKDILMPEPNVQIVDDSVTQLSELSFPWPLINALEQSYNALRSKPKLCTELIFSYHLQLLIFAVIYILCIVFGSVFLTDCLNGRMLCIAFIIQGTCGLFVLAVHAWKIVSK